MTDKELADSFRSLEKLILNGIKQVTDLIDKSMVINAHEFERVHKRIDGVEDRLGDFQDQVKTSFDSVDRRLDSRAVETGEVKQRVKVLETKNKS